MNTTIVYKVLTPAQWSEVLETGRFTGAPIDLADGFIHLSSAHQLVETVRKHFRGHGELFVVAFDADLLGGDLKWETSRGGDLFPHLYSPLLLSHVIESFTLPVNDLGEHAFPPGPWDKTT
jgi:uncharacterized protein (DUF952 family)